jgi:hypothetical protein
MAMQPPLREFELHALVERGCRGLAEVEVVETEPKVRVGAVCRLGCSGSQNAASPATGSTLNEPESSWFLPRWLTAWWVATVIFMARMRVICSRMRVMVPRGPPEGVT